MIALFAFITGLAAVTSCHAVSSDRIYGRDLAAADSRFQAVPADLPIGLAPFPGQQRSFRSGELLRLAQANGVALDTPQPVCFEWPMSALDPTRVRAAMEKTLAGRSPQITIVELSKVAIPPGEISFPLEGLSGVSTGPVIWRGSVSFADHRHFTIWARVQVKVRDSRVVASEALRPGDEIRQEQVSLETYEGPLTREPYLTSLADVSGSTARNPINAGQPLTRILLRNRLAVERGDLVQVTVELHSAHLEAQGVAEEGGLNGSVITVRNDRSGRKFRARIESKGKVLVVPEGPTGLVVEEKRHEAGN